MRLVPRLVINKDGEDKVISVKAGIGCILDGNSKEAR
jgi:hypothetical protein